MQPNKLSWRKYTRRRERTSNSYCTIGPKSSWLNSTIKLATTLGFSTWGIWPQSGTWRMIAFGSSQCNFCIKVRQVASIRVIRLYNHRVHNVKSDSTRQISLSKRQASFFMNCINLFLLKHVLLYNNRGIWLYSCFSLLPEKTLKVVLTTASLLLIIWSSSPHIISVLCLTCITQFSIAQL